MSDGPDAIASAGIALSPRPAIDPFWSGTEMGARMRVFDWSRTPVGSVDAWPRSLRTILHIILTSRHPLFLWWGPELVQFYNDGYRPSLGEDRHPAALGARGREFWADIWPTIGPQIEAVMERGESSWHEDHHVPIARNGRIEEVYWTYSFSPVPDDDGGIGGTLVTVQETTPRVLTERRMVALRALAERTSAEGRTVEDTCRVAAEVLAGNDADVAFALLYLLDHGGREPRLAQHVGALPGPALRTDIATDDVEVDGAGWPVARVARRGRAELVTDLRSRFGVLPGGCWPEPAESAMVVPIARGRQDGRDGVLVAGLSPRLGFDEN